MQNTWWCTVLLIGLINCGGDDPDPQEMGSEDPSIIDWLKLRYGKPRASECTQNEDCGDGCCRQITNQYQQCYTDADDACHVRWTGSPPSFLPRWEADKRAPYTGDFEADVIEERVVEVWGSGRSRIYKLANGQYWEAIAPSKEPAEGDTVRIAPGPYLYNMDAGGVETPIDLLGVMQLPVVADTEVVGPSFNGMEQDGIYALLGAGYWRTAEASASTEPRVILTTPNNVDFWLYTSTIARAYTEPTEVYADGDVVGATATEFTLDDGTSWHYMTRPLDPVLIGARAVVFNLEVYDDRHIDHAYPHQYCWHEGGETFGEWVAPL